MLLSAALRASIHVRRCRISPSCSYNRTAFRTYSNTTHPPESAPTTSESATPPGDTKQVTSKIPGTYCIFPQTNKPSSYKAGLLQFLVTVLPASILPVVYLTYSALEWQWTWATVFACVVAGAASSFIGLAAHLVRTKFISGLHLNRQTNQLIVETGGLLPNTVKTATYSVKNVVPLKRPYVAVKETRVGRLVIQPEDGKYPKLYYLPMQNVDVKLFQEITMGRYKFNRKSSDVEEGDPNE